MKSLSQSTLRPPFGFRAEGILESAQGGGLGSHLEEIFASPRRRPRLSLGLAAPRSQHKRFVPPLGSACLRREALCPTSPSSTLPSLGMDGKFEECSDFTH